jgi:2-hydroxychromene-2-carboxylate isomerase
MGNAEQEAGNRPIADQHVANQYVADWYFDFVSPFAYLQSEQLAALAPRIMVRYKPVLFAGILGAHGQLGPAEIPAKRAFTYRFVLWQAKQLGIPLKLPHEHPFNPLPLLRLAIACDCEASAIHRIFRFVWRDGRLPDLPIEWAELTQELGLADADARIAEPEVKDTLRRYTDEAIALGVFGVPTLALRGELFWGADATQMAADFAAAGCRWTDPEFARAAVLPIGAARDAGKARKRS